MPVRECAASGSIQVCGSRPGGVLREMKSLRLKLAVAAALLLALPAVRAVEGYEESSDRNSVTWVRADAKASAALKIMQPLPEFSTTKSYAQHVMDTYRGWDLSPKIEVRGFSFKYVDNAPCAGLLTYFDGRSYLLFLSCGEIDRHTLKELYTEASARLKLSEILKKQSRPFLY